jgi:rhodanese-related sulfurtransferase
LNKITQQNQTSQSPDRNRAEGHDLARHELSAFITSFKQPRQQGIETPKALPTSPDIEFEVETPAPLSALAAEFKLLDVREADERQAFPVFADAVVPYSAFDLSQVIFPPDTPVLVMCTKGQRGRAVAQKLRQAGWHSAYSLRGGLQNWQQNDAA